MKPTDAFPAQLLALHPVRHALQDPHYTLVQRPIDSRWATAGVTSRVTGFNPWLDQFYFASGSTLATLLTRGADVVHAEQWGVLASETLALAHDYIHSWTYRFMAQVAPDLTEGDLASDLTIERHSFLLVLSECAAVIALDYWYLCCSTAGDRCGADAAFGGPLTVSYSERLLGTYRQSFQTLTVQTPEFFSLLLRLYAEGVINGVDEQDLLGNRTLSDWLIRELLIAPRQRLLARLWTLHRTGKACSDADPSGPFIGMTEQYRSAIDQLASALWALVKEDRTYFPPPTSSARSQRHLGRSTGVDYRFANWRSATTDEAAAATSSESWAAYVDQKLSTHEFPADECRLVPIIAAVENAKSNHDAQGLNRLLQQLVPIRGEDAAPHDLIIVN